MWSKHPGGLLKKPSLLVCDQFKAHVTESTQRLATKLKTHLAVIPGGLTSQLQPLDVSVNKPFKGTRNGQSGLKHQLITLHWQEEWNGLRFLMFASG